MMLFKKGIIFISICFVAFLSLHGVTFAADEVATGGYLANYGNATDPRPSAISWWSTAAYLVSLLVIFAFVVGMAYLAARFLGGHFAKSRVEGSGGKILANLPLGPGKSVIVADLAGKVLLLGVTEQQISLITEVTNQDEIEKLRLKKPLELQSGDLFNQQFGALSNIVKNISPLFRK